MELIDILNHGYARHLKVKNSEVDLSFKFENLLEEYPDMRDTYILERRALVSAGHQAEPAILSARAGPSDPQPVLKNPCRNSWPENS